MRKLDTITKPSKKKPRKPNPKRNTKSLPKLVINEPKRKARKVVKVSWIRNIWNKISFWNKK